VWLSFTLIQRKVGSLILALCKTQQQSPLTIWLLLVAAAAVEAP